DAQFGNKLGDTLQHHFLRPPGQHAGISSRYVQPEQAAAGNGEGEASAPVDAAAVDWQPSQSTAVRTAHAFSARWEIDSSVPTVADDTSYWQRVDEAMGSFTGRQQRVFAGSSDRSAEALEDFDELTEQLVDEALLQFDTFQDGN
ncbi:MAG: hypothetical protein ABGX05_01235, partial [Pirellulaceae bacterium]